MNFELSHDSVARHVWNKMSQGSRMRRRVERFIKEKHELNKTQGLKMSKDDLEFIRPFMNTVGITEEEYEFINSEESRIKRNLFFVRLIVLATISVLSASVLFSFFAYEKQEKALIETEQQRKLVEAEKDKTDIAYLEQEKALIETEQQRKLVEEEKDKTDIAYLEQEKALIETEQQRKLVEEEKNKAVFLTLFYKEKSLQNYARAIYYLDQYYELNSNKEEEPLLMLERAEILYESGEFEKAEDIFAAILEKIGEEERSRYLLKHIDLLMLGNKPDKAITAAINCISESSLELTNVTGIIVNRFVKAGKEQYVSTLIENLYTSLEDNDDKNLLRKVAADYFLSLGDLENAEKILNLKKENDQEEDFFRLRLSWEKGDLSEYQRLKNKCFLGAFADSVFMYPGQEHPIYRYHQNENQLFLEHCGKVVKFNKKDKGVWVIGNKNWNKNFVYWHNDFIETNTKLSGSLVNVGIAAIANEANFDGLNTWDDHFFSFGPGRWGLGTSGNKGELSAFLALVKESDQELFTKYFGVYGLDVTSLSDSKTLGYLSLNGTQIKTVLQKERFRLSPFWAFIFWEAAQDKRIMALEYEFLLQRVESFYTNDNYKVLNTYYISDLITSEYGVALLLDHHLNRPGHLMSYSIGKKDILGQALKASGVETKPGLMTTADENAILDAYLELRYDSSMTHGHERALTIKKLLDLGFLSRERGSFYSSY